MAGSEPVFTPEFLEFVEFCYSFLGWAIRFTRGVQLMSIQLVRLDQGPMGPKLAPYGGAVMIFTRWYFAWARAQNEQYYEEEYYDYSDDDEYDEGDEGVEGDEDSEDDEVRVKYRY